MLSITLQCDHCKTIEELQFRKNQTFHDFQCPDCKHNGMTVKALENDSITAIKQLYSDHEFRIHKLEQIMRSFIESHDGDNEEILREFDGEN